MDVPYCEMEDWQNCVTDEQTLDKQVHRLIWTEKPVEEMVSLRS